MKISNKAITVGEGKDCPKCYKPMERRKHPAHWKSSKTYYYTQWDFCKKCQHVQHYEEFKSAIWIETERQESFLRTI